MNYLTAKAVADRFAVHPATVRKGLSIFARLTRYPFGSRGVRFSVEEVEALDSALQKKAGPNPVFERHLQIVGKR